MARLGVFEQLFEISKEDCELFLPIILTHFSQKKKIKK